MENKQYLTFHLHDLQYGLEASLVQEILPLPELIIIPEAPLEIIGLLNMHGQIVPILHLYFHQGHLKKDCHLSDYVIIMQWESLQFGLVVHQADEVLELNAEVIETEISDERLDNIDPVFIVGVTKIDAGNIILLDPKTLISQPDAILPLIWDVQSQLDVMAASPTSDTEQLLEQNGLQQDKPLQTPKLISRFYDLYCPNITAEERAIFQQRAEALRQPIESLKVVNELIHLAVIGLANNYFGLELELVKEFTNIANLTPIPCCPKHIVGNMNLRGEIVTLVDIRNVLNLPAPPIGIGSQVVVVQVDDIVAGLPVDQVLEMVYLNSADLISLSGILSDVGEQYLRGTALFQQGVLSVLDLPKIFTRGELTVNEEA